ncbi:single-stranded DNA-binding protein WHY1, chloroplastic isoform X2 [Ziziphus jujuba]|uniref:Single-stranded DNA-binding protein WHY1, chloroplastic isoform X2 n=1 Tax=Ziziphus jujuba TaxID=326968 RepID=A0ABM3I2L1_ZIZJJ|nr:single-stranded DNA-binding protein WHY1, chloroplastic isoform X2 [Ziziphus jujuba]
MMLRLDSLSSSVALQSPSLCGTGSLSSQRSTRTTSLTFNGAVRFAPNPYLVRKKRLSSVKCRQSEYFDQQRFITASAPNNSSFDSETPPGGSLPPRFFVGHSIYKGKAALTVEPKAPEFTPLDSGAFKVSREGFVLLQFAPAAGVRQYDWSRKQVFSLSVTEIGNLISLGSRESCEFFHDPFKGKSDEGKVRKVLKVEPLPDGSGRFFNLGVQNKLINVDESIYIPITRAEYAVLTSAFNFILPYLLGWHAFANSIKPDDANNVNSTNRRYRGDYEWTR